MSKKLEAKLKAWKEKAVCRTKELKYLKRKLSDTEESRKHFKAKYYALKSTLKKKK